MSEAVLITPQARRVLTYVAGMGLFAAVVGIIAAPARTWPGLLVASQYVLGLSLGSVFFIALMLVCGARWWDSLRSVPEALAGALPWAAGLALFVAVIGLPWLYGWNAPHDHHAGAGFRDFWLQPGFFRIRAVLYVCVWLLMLSPVIRAARAEPRRVGVAAGFIVLFAVTFLLASFDWLMSLDTHWFSTIFGVYNFAGAFLSTLAAVGALAVLLRRRLGVSEDALHDLGKLMHAFSVFWAYIWFSQYMLIWYANLPEETSYYLLRHGPGWASLSLLNVALNWAVPFIVLLPRSAKRNASTLLQVSLLLLIGRAVDLYWMLMPVAAAQGGAVHVWGVVALVGAGAMIALILSRRLDAPYQPAPHLAGDHNTQV